MTWVRLEDSIDEHPKIAAIDDSAFSLFVCGLAYCNRNLTDGFIPNQVGLGQLRFADGDTTPAIRQLENAHLWVKVEGGWQVHDFHDYQPSKEQVLADREAARLRQERSRKKSRRDTPVNHAGVTPTPVPDTERTEDLKPPSAVVDDGFETFWKLYPPRDGKKLDKRKAQRLWKGLSQANKDAAMIGVSHYAASGQRAKDAHRWLRDQCWQDWQTPARPDLRVVGNPNPTFDMLRQMHAEESRGQA